MYTPTSQNPPGMLDQGEQKENNCVYHFFCWFFQIGVWIAIGVEIYLAIASSDNVKNGAWALGFCYVVYLILEFLSPTARYLMNKSDDKGMYEKMGIHFRTPPVISFHCECYHYETHHYTTRDKQGHVHHHTRRVRRTTYTETYKLPYYSERDVSGLFYLNCNKAYIEKKHYIKLNLIEEINFADAISYMDYEREKDDFWRRNRFRDVHFDFTESRYVPGMKHHNLVRLTETDPCTVNCGFLILFTLLTFAQFYKSYVNTFCVYQKFKVRKLVSTRYDLNQPVYVNFVPQLDLIFRQYSYQPNDYNYINQDYNLELPTKEELEKAKQFQDKVPDYQLSSGGGMIQAGVIKDDPNFSSFNPNLPPAAFASVSGNVALDPSQVNAQGTLPNGFDKPGFQFNIAPPEPQEQDYPPPQDYPSELELRAAQDHPLKQELPLCPVQDNNQAPIQQDNNQGNFSSEGQQGYYPPNA